MDSNTHSTRPSEPPRPPDRHLDELAALAAAVDGLAARELDRLTDAALAERVLALRRLGDRLDGEWLKTLAAVDARGAAGAEDGLEVGSTAGWLRTRLRLAPGTAAKSVRTARALFRGPLPQTAAALCAGDLSATHATAAAHGTRHLPDHVTEDADPVIMEAARRFDPRQLRRASATSARSSTPTAPTRPPNATMNAGGMADPDPRPNGRRRRAAGARGRPDRAGRPGAVGSPG